MCRFIRYIDREEKRPIGYYKYSISTRALGAYTAVSERPREWLLVLHARWRQDKPTGCKHH